MGTDNIHHIRKEKKLQRAKKSKECLPYILIVCEGEKTEPNYFEWYRKNCKQQINININGEGMNTIGLVKETVKIQKRIEKEEYIKFDQVWSVFDRDSFKLCDYNAAFEFANRHNIKVAYSNECFEVWYLLHFMYFDNSMSRTQVFKKLDKELKRNFQVAYRKNKENIFELLRDRQKIAIENAKKLYINSINSMQEEQQNPSTCVFKLVEELNKYIKA